MRATIATKSINTNAVKTEYPKRSLFKPRFTKCLSFKDANAKLAINSKTPIWYIGIWCKRPIPKSETTQAMTHITDIEVARNNNNVSSRPEPRLFGNDVRPSTITIYWLVTRSRKMATSIEWPDPTANECTYSTLAQMSLQSMEPPTHIAATIAVHNAPHTNTKLPTLASSQAALQ